MGKNKNYNYFEELLHLSEYSCECASFLHNTLKNFDAKVLGDKVEEMHQIEHTADIEKHEMMNHLVKEFITPIEREDIIGLSQNIDNVTDAVEDVLIYIHLFQIKSLRKEATEFSKIIVKCCQALNASLKEFKNFHKSKTLQKQLIEVNRLEEEGDTLYHKAVKELHRNYTNPVELFVWTDLFAKFEKCCDACEDAANMVEVIIIKNS